MRRFLSWLRRPAADAGDRSRPADAAGDAPDLRDLLQWSDGRLAAGTPRAAAVQRYLREHPEVAQQLQDWQRQDAAIAALYAPVLSEAVPERLQPAALRAGRRQRRQWRAGVALAAVLVAALAALPWLLQAPQDPLQRFAASVAEGEAVAAAAPPPAAEWRPPDLQLAGFAVAAQEPVRLGDEAATRIVYEDGEGNRLQLFTTSEALPERERVHRLVRGDRQVIFWRDGGRMYALTADSVDGQRLQDLAVASLRGDARQPAGVAAVPGGETDSIAEAPPPAEAKVSTTVEGPGLLLEQDVLSPQVQEPPSP